MNLSIVNKTYTRISHKRSLRYYQNLNPAYSLSVLDAVSIMTVR